MHVLVVNGPNMNLLGRREPEIYGAVTLSEIERRMEERAQKYDIELEFFQSNSEGAILDKIQQAFDKIELLILNPAAYTHTSVALRDLLQAAPFPTFEVHMSNIYAREEFRMRSLISPVCDGVLAGFGADAYLLALDAANLMKNGK